MPRRSGSGAPILLLVPTELEARALDDAGGIEPGLALSRTCGFGPIAAAACAARALAHLTPARVVLAGIAGSYDTERLAVGAAARFSRVAIDGLETAGFEQAPGIQEILDLELPRDDDDAARVLVTVSSPSRSRAEARARQRAHPGACAEDMEAYGVAMSCALARVPLCVVRGISNAAGDRDRANWRVADAMAQVRRLLREELAR